jgi:AhpD family alkylhydroperoxidase
MDTENREKIKKIIRERKYAHTFYSKNSKVYRSFLDMERQTYTDGALAKKHKELIALGISVVIDCESCIEWHLGEAFKSGATREEIIEAIEVGFEMGGGPATVSGRFAFRALEYYATDKAGPKASPSKKG